MEDFLKLAVNYGLGIFFAVGISIAFFLYAREKDKQSYARELALMSFMEEHSLKTQTLVESNIMNQSNIAALQKQEHDLLLQGLKTATETLNMLVRQISTHQ